jgi:hypothetical protein
MDKPGLLISTIGCIKKREKDTHLTGIAYHNCSASGI